MAVCGRRSVLTSLFWHDDPCDDVDEDAADDAGEYGEYGPDQSDHSRINVQI